MSVLRLSVLCVLSVMHGFNCVVVSLTACHHNILLICTEQLLNKGATLDFSMVDMSFVIPVPAPIFLTNI